MSLLYAPVAMTVMVAICLLAIDYGRAQLVKSELQQAADAAALAGVSSLRSGVAQARARAITAAAYNRSEGTAIALSSEDVQIGRWNEALGEFEATTTSPDAVQVSIGRTEAQGNAVGLLFGGLFERNSADVSVVAIARRDDGAAGPSFVGLSFVQAKNNTLASYDSSQGAPASGSNLLGNAALGSNGTITFNKPVAGDAVIVVGPNGSYAGQSKALDAPLAYPPTETPSVPLKGVLNVTQSIVHPGGTHYYTAITFVNNVKLDFAGPATIYVRDRIEFQQGNTITAADKVPANLKVRIIGGPSSYVGGNNANNVDITADVYAPNTDLISKNNAYLRGRGIFRSMYAKNNLELYADRAFFKQANGLVR